MKYQSGDRPVIECLGTVIPEGAVIFDVGAHLGGYAKEFARLYHGNVFVHCFEPSPYNLSILQDVTRRFGNVCVSQLALSDQAGTIDLYLPVKASGRLAIGLGHFGMEEERDYVMERVQTMTLDSYAADAGVDRLDFIKCDVEGAEFLVLKGGAETIRRFRPTIYVEVFENYIARMGHSAKDIFDFLSPFGYDVYQMQFEPCAPVRVDGYQGPENYLFRAQK
ncbi:MAG: FkbM family methyltransferase [Alphaproteobacteria bacterium]|nr:FkbM family methyltransferase [Alphaproteobacteria bacterium]